MITNDNVNGNLVLMRTSSPRHYGDSSEITGKKAEGDSSFAGILKKVVDNVNDLQVESENLTQKMIYDPDSVDIHTVMITAQKAELALTLTKTVRDEAIRAFREIMNLR